MRTPDEYRCWPKSLPLKMMREKSFVVSHLQSAAFSPPNESPLRHSFLDETVSSLIAIRYEDDSADCNAIGQNVGQNSPFRVEPASSQFVEVISDHSSLFFIVVYYRNNFIINLLYCTMTLDTQ